MSIKAMRETVATQVNTIEYETGKNLRVKAHPVKGNVRKGDGWVVVDTTTPGQFLGTDELTLNVWVSLGSDETYADAKIDDLIGPLLRAAETLYGSNVSVQQRQIVAGDGVPGAVYALVLVLTVEVSS